MDRIIVKNSVWLFSVQIIVKIISFFYVIFLARSLGVENFGLYIVALSYFSLVSSFADFGINRFLIREIATGKKQVAELLSTAIFLRLSILSVFFAVSAVVFSSLDPDLERRNLSMLAVLAVLPQSVSLTLDAIFVALLRVKFSALGILSLSILTTTTGTILVLARFGAYGAVLGLIIGQFLYSLTLIIFAYWKKIRWLAVMNERLITQFFKGALPYGILSVLGLVYFKIDSLLLSYMKGSFDTGIYGASYKFLEAILFIPSVFITASFPVLAKYHKKNINLVKKTYYKSLKILTGLGITILLGYLFILPPVIKILLPQYQGSIEAIKILAVTIPFMFAQTPAVLVLFSTEKFLKTVILLSILTVIFNIILNIILIPSFGYIGASVVTVLSEILSFVVFYMLLKIKVFKDEKL